MELSGLSSTASDSTAGWNRVLEKTLNNNNELITLAFSECFSQDGLYMSVSMTDRQISRWNRKNNNKKWLIKH